MRYGLSVAGASVLEVGALTKEAEDAGFEIALTNDNRGTQDTFIKLAAMAISTSKINLGTGICRAFVRTPIATGTAAMTLDELSHGRMVLCLGGGTRRQLDYGIEIDHGAARLKEVIEIMRLLWANHPKLFQYDGKFYQLQGDRPGAQLGTEAGASRRIPVYMATVREAAIRMMGEIADGSAGHPNWHIGYINKIVLPNLEIGLKRAGRSRADFDLSGYRITHIVGGDVDRKTARRRAAREIAGYMQVRSYSVLMDCVGWTKEKEAIYDAALRRRDPEATIDAITDEMIDEIALVGTPDEVLEKVKRYEGVYDRIILHGGGTDNKRRIIETFAPLLSLA